MTSPHKSPEKAYASPAVFRGGIGMAMAAALVYVADRLTKQAVSSVLAEGESVPVIDGVFHITLVHNPGGAFGVLRAYPQIFTAAAIAFAVIAFLYTIFHWFSMTLRDKAAISLLLGGALGNLSDRIRLGYVVDFMDFRVWPVFNVADSCISVGAAILILSVITTRRCREDGSCTE